MSQIIYISQLEQIDSHREELYAYTLDKKGFHEVPGSFLGRGIAWILNKLGIRTNAQLFQDFATPQLQNLKSYLNIKLGSESLLDIDLLDRISKICKDFQSTHKAICKEIDLIANKLEDLHFVDAPDEFFFTPSTSMESLLLPSPIIVSSEIAPTFIDSIEDRLHKFFQHEAAVRLIISLLPKNILDVNHVDDHLFVSYPQPLKGIVPKVDLPGWSLISYAEVEVAPLLRITFNRESKNITISQGHIKGTPKKSSSLGGKLLGFISETINLSVNIQSVSLEEDGFKIGTNLKNVSITFQEFQTIFSNLSFQ